MKVFYSGYYKSDDVDPGSPVDVGYSQVSDILWNLESKGAFLGVDLGGSVTFQAMNQEDHFYAEILDTKTLEVLSSDLGIAVVDALLEQIFGGADVFEAAEALGVSWEIGNLERPFLPSRG